MKMNVKMIAAAVALVVSGASQAAFTTGAAGGADTSLVFAAWDGTTSYIENLSATNAAGLAGAWVATNGTPTSANFQLNALFGTTFANSANLNWAVFGGTGSVGQAINTTGLANVTASTAGNIASANASLDSWFAALNNTAVGTNNFGTLTLSDANSPSIVAPGYNGFVIGNTFKTGYGFIEFETLVDDGAGGALLIHDAPVKGFTLASNGALTYGQQAAASVPLPAAAWLFGSGLLGLIGIGRRKQA